jgi:hypothetical protein
MEPALQRHRAVRGHWRVASRRLGHPAAPAGHHEGARLAGRGWRPHSSGGAGEGAAWRRSASSSATCVRKPGPVNGAASPSMARWLAARQAPRR